MDKLAEIYDRIAALGKRYGVYKIVLFGSRARCDYREKSDIDIAVFGLPAGSRGMFWAEVEELPTLLSFDVVFAEEASDELLKNIKEDGVVIYEERF